ncbi:MAG: TolC family protein [Gemmatimonadales bacterium]
MNPPFVRLWRTIAAILALSLTAGSANAQQLRPVSRADAVQSAIEHAPRLLTAASDTTAAAAALRNARLMPDPTAAFGYSKSAPRYHVELSIPLDLPWIRNARTAAAQSGRAGSQLRLAFARVAAQLDADTAYTAALASRELLALSRRNSHDADSLHRIAAVRRDAGDASELDVELASIFAGQQANTLAGDSLTAESALFTLQAAMGIVGSEITITLADSLMHPHLDSFPVGSGGRLLPVAAAESDVQTAELQARMQRRSRIIEPTLTAGFETGDPGGSETGMLPTVGIAIPLPLFNGNRGNVALAEAELQRAQAALAAIRVESTGALGRARRALRAGLEQVTRDEQLTASADRVSAMSLTAYREGAATLASVLEAQRMARDVRSQYVADLASAWIARSVLLLLTETTASSVP